MSVTQYAFHSMKNLKVTDIHYRTTLHYRGQFAENNVGFALIQSNEFRVKHEGIAFFSQKETPQY